MAWEVLTAPEFAEWLRSQDEAVRVALASSLVSLRSSGPGLGRPLADTLKGSKLSNLKELRVGIGGAPYRFLFAFDPIRRAVLLVGGDKGVNKRWYSINIPIVEARFERHLAQLKEEK